MFGSCDGGIYGFVAVITRGSLLTVIRRVVDANAQLRLDIDETAC
jgi:hypothetical protein